MLEISNNYCNTLSTKFPILVKVNFWKKTHMENVNFFKKKIDQHQLVTIWNTSIWAEDIPKTLNQKYKVSNTHFSIFSICFRFSSSSCSFIFAISFLMAASSATSLLFFSFSSNWILSCAILLISFSDFSFCFELFFRRSALCCCTYSQKILIN